MSEQDAVGMLKKLISDWKKAKDELENSEEILEMQNRLMELEEKSNNELSEESKSEIAQINTHFESIIEQTMQKLLSGINQKDMIDILEKISQEFIEKNNIGKSVVLDEIIISFLQRIEDANCKICNNLLASQDFINCLSFPQKSITQLIEKTNDEKAVVDFLESYCRNFNKWDRDNRANIITDFGELGSFIVAILNSKNYSEEFKDYILSNQKLLPYISDSSIRYIISKSNFSKSKKLDLIIRPEIFDALPKTDFSSLLGELCENYNDFQNFIAIDKFAQNIDIGCFLESSILTSVDLMQILLDDRIKVQISGGDLCGLLTSKNYDFKTKKSLLSDEFLFSKLSGFDMAKIVGQKYLTSEQRFELLNDKKIVDLIFSGAVDFNVNSGLFNFNGAFSFESMPLIDKVAIVKNEKFMNYIDKEIIQEIIFNPDLDIDTANDILFDKRFFYRLIGEWNDTFNCPNNFRGYKGPFKYDKYEYLKKLYSKNPYLVRTIVFDLFQDNILDLGFDFIERMSKYPIEAKSLAYALSDENSSEYLKNMIRCVENLNVPGLDIIFFMTRLIEISRDNSYYSENPKEIKKISKIIYNKNFDTKEFTDSNWKTITEIGMRDFSLYYNGISSSMFGVLKDEIDFSLNILPDINTIDDLNNYQNNRIVLCDECFRKAVVKKNLYDAKNAYLNKYFNINIQEAHEIVRMFGNSIEKFADKHEYESQVKYIENIKRILDIQKIHVIAKQYFESENRVLTFEETIFFEQSIRQMFSKEISDSVYKVTDKIKDENDEYIFNQSKEMEFVIEENDNKLIKKVSVFEPGYEFKMLVHSTAAYGKMELINNNYFDSWNNSSRKSNHGICCSLISNDNLSIAMVNDVLFGFDGWDSKSITKIAPYDIYSANDGYDIQEGRPLVFMSAQDIIDNTRHSHNELVLERNELRNDKKNQMFQNIQPSYVIIYSDMDDEIKQNSIKCSSEMNIPIVFLDKEKIIQHEVDKIDKKIQEFNSCKDMEMKLTLLDQILLSHENNRSGLKWTNNDWVDKYFPTTKIEILLDQIISEIQAHYQETNDIVEYFKNSNRLISILEKENNKFSNAMETTERSNYMDISIDKYISQLMQYININLCRNNTPKLMNIIKVNQFENSDSTLTQIFSEIDCDFLSKQIDDIMTNKLYLNADKNHGIEHIERVMFLSQLLGRQELKLDNGSIDEHAISLLTECAKYHDCGRKSDYYDNRHGLESAKKMEPYLFQKGFSKNDIKLMQVVVEYHADIDDDFRFEKICDKYEIERNQRDYVKKIANILKDSDALDRVRFLNSDSKLNKQMLRFDFSKELIPIIKELYESYKSYDKQQFELSCRYIQEQKVLKSTLAQNDSNEYFELSNHGRNM